MTPTRRIVVAGLALAVGASGRPGDARAADAPVVVFAAASLKNALDEAVAGWSKATGKTATVSYAGSNVLAKQIEAGAPADLFFSADRAWMDYAEGNGTVRAGTRVDLLRNTIVLIAPKDSSAKLELGPGVDLAKALDGGRLATANVEAVPAGRYGKAALDKLGAWDAIKDRLAQAENVRAALLLVARGEAPLGIVYASDAVSDPSVKVVAAFPADSHPPIIYPVAVTTESRNADAVGLLDYLRSPAARPFFERQGFAVIGAERRT